MNKRNKRPSSGKQIMSANLRKIARQNQLYGFHMALDGIAAKQKACRTTGRPARTCFAGGWKMTTSAVS